METITSALLAHLRVMAKRGDTASQMLREIMRTYAPATPHNLPLIKCLREAFGLSLREASPIGGWAPDGSGELSDSRLDELIMPDIAKNRPVWEEWDTTLWSK